jgi:hypothetical protein
MAETKKIHISGGPARESFGKENVIPVSFNEDDPFGALTGKLNKLESLARKGQLVEVFIAIGMTDESGEGSYVDYVWLGKERLTSMLGTIEYAKELLKRDNITRSFDEEE